ncbi:valine--tRNA ligase, partial [Candidatus Micrarchaeota archaeon]|nr:valine--tRNA ligase [Candidatus Micrarchaeota archaeon]
MQELKRYSPKEAEKKWGSYWQQKGIFNFNPNSKKPVFAIDTPPPTVSGIIHVGHIFSYSQADFIASYKRMKGMYVFYPFGFDDNGLPTEKHVEKARGIKAKEIGRKEFNKIVREEVVKVEKEFKQIWSSVGLSCDWNLFYSTISPPVQKLSQLSFIELYEKGREYRKEAPTLWCPNCETAIAQVELEDKQLSTKFSDIFFELDSGEKLIISTTRPELLSACVAVLVHPEDEKNRHLIGRKVLVPLFDYLVPIIGDKRVDKEKGSGIVMCCTFGDTVDVEWWKAYSLPLKIVLNPDGTLNEKAGKYNGMKLKEAREAILNDLNEKGLLGEQREISHTVNTHDRCSTEIEFLLTKQWFIKYLDLKEEFLKAGRKLKWFPPHMRNRYENWVKGLQWDWCISRQRYYGIPFPVWYCKKCGETILAEKKDLPVDPLIDKPKKKCKCGSNEFEPENDILDTWTTSSLTPLINSKWKGSALYDKKIFPMNLRPQAHDIISFWAFNTIVKSLLHTKKVPW